MNNYGEPIYDQNNNLKGYKINDTEFASVYIYYNKDNLLCNKVTIKEISAMYKATKYFELISWLDIKTDTGFIREFNKNKYYYDKNNKLINVETPYNYPSLPVQKKDLTLDKKIGTIDFETFGSNFGLGYHQVYAGGWAVNNIKQLFFLKYNESSEQLVNRLILSILMNPKFDGYTFYAHNLGRFDSIFILKSLITNKNIKLTPVLKDNSIISLVIKFNKIKITSFKTLPGLALAVYRSSYIPESLNHEIKMTKGELEREIRSSYFGGNVDVFFNEVRGGYHYDLNSQYPAAMLNDMPVGDPVLSLETDLNKIFGFAYGEIYCPT